MARPANKEWNAMPSVPNIGFGSTKMCANAMPLFSQLRDASRSRATIVTRANDKRVFSQAGVGQPLPDSCDRFIDTEQGFTIQPVMFGDGGVLMVREVEAASDVPVLCLEDLESGKWTRQVGRDGKRDAA